MGICAIMATNKPHLSKLELTQSLRVVFLSKTMIPWQIHAFLKKKYITLSITFLSFCGLHSCPSVQTKSGNRRREQPQRAFLLFVEREETQHTWNVGSCVCVCVYPPILRWCSLITESYLRGRRGVKNGRAEGLRGSFRCWSYSRRSRRWKQLLPHSLCCVYAWWVCAQQPAIHQHRSGLLFSYESLLLSSCLGGSRCRGWSDRWQSGLRISNLHFCAFPFLQLFIFVSNNSFWSKFFKTSDWVSLSDVPARAEKGEGRRPWCPPGSQSRLGADQPGVGLWKLIQLHLWVSAFRSKAVCMEVETLFMWNEEVRVDLHGPTSALSIQVCHPPPHLEFVSVQTGRRGPGHPQDDCGPLHSGCQSQPVDRPAVHDGR